MVVVMLSISVHTNQQDLIVFFNFSLPLISVGQAQIRCVIFVTFIENCQLLYIQAYIDLIAGTMLTQAASFFPTIPLCVRERNASMNGILFTLP